MNNASRKQTKINVATPALIIRKRKSSSIANNNNNNNNSLLANRNLIEINNKKYPLIAEDSGFSEPFRYFFFY